MESLRSSLVRKNISKHSFFSILEQYVVNIMINKIITNWVDPRYRARNRTPSMRTFGSVTAVKLEKTGTLDNQKIEYIDHLRLFVVR